MSRVRIEAPERKAVLRPALIGVAVTLVLFVVFLVGALSWMFSLERYSPDAAVQVEVFSMGETLSVKNSENTFTLAETEDGQPIAVLVGSSAQIPARGEAFKAWFIAEENAGFTLNSEATRSSAGQGYYSLEKPARHLNHHSDGMWVIGLSAIAIVFLATFFVFTRVIFLVSKSDTSPRIGSIPRQNWLKSKIKVDKHILKQSNRVTAIMVVLYQLAFAVAVFFWVAGPDSSFTDHSLVVLIIMGNLILPTFVFGGILLAAIEPLPVFLFSRLVTKDVGRFPVSVLEDEPNPSTSRVNAWIESQNWDEETFKVLLSNFEGTLGELSVVVTSLAPDRDLVKI